MVTRGGLDFYSLWQDSALGLSRVFFKNQKSKIRNQNHNVGAFRSLQLFNSDSGVGLHTQKRSFKRGNSPFWGKLYAKPYYYTV